jgi:hypothetical protein
MAAKQAYFDPYAAYVAPAVAYGGGGDRGRFVAPNPTANAYAELWRGNPADAPDDPMDEEADQEGAEIDDDIDQLFALNPADAVADAADDDSKPVEVKMFHSSNDIIRYQEAEEMRKKVKARGAKRKPKSARVWKPNNQYNLIRRGRPLPRDPDAMGKDLREEYFFYFQHVPVEDGRDVEFAADPHRPLWKGVFQVPPDCGCGPDEYWNPTQANYKVTYVVVVVVTHC